MKRYKPMFEKRSHSELNPVIGAWDYLEKYKNDPDIYISFTEIDKIGINPMSKYNTPTGIYTFPLKEFVELYVNPKYSYNKNDVGDKFNNSIGFYSPFAGNSKYINFIRVKDKSHFIDDMYTDYGSDKYDRDIKILTKIYTPIWKKLHPQQTFDYFVFLAIEDSKDKNPVMAMWNITRILAKSLSTSDKQASTKWNLILSQDLGYSGFADKSGKGYIHPSEPMQAVFFRTSAFEVITREENIPAKDINKKRPIRNEKDIQVGDIFWYAAGEEKYTVTSISSNNITFVSLSGFKKTLPAIEFFKEIQSGSLERILKIN